VRAYCDELYAVLSPAIPSGAKQSPEGFDLAALQNDLRAIAA